MQKKKLANFIDKYYLNGQGSNSVLINFDVDTTRTIFYGPDRSVIGLVTLKEGLELGDIGIFQTDVFMKLLTAFDDDEHMVITKRENSSGIVMSLHFSSDNVDVTATTSDPAVIPEIDMSKINPETMKLSNEPTFDIEFDIDQSFMGLFKRYAAAANADIFAFEAKNGACNLVMNYSKNNTNQIRYNLDGVIPTSDFVICFGVHGFSEIFNANKDCSGRMAISKAGLARIELNNDDYDCRYYPLKIALKE